MNAASVAVLVAVAVFILLGQLNSFHALRRLSGAQVEYLDRKVDMSTQYVVDKIVAQLAKAKDEIVAKLESATSDVQSQLVEAGVADQVDLSALAAIAQQLDDIVPDEVVVDPEVDEAEGSDDVELVDLGDEDDEVVEVDEAVDEAVEEDEDGKAV